MSIASSSLPSRLRRTTAVVAAGLIAAALSFGGASAAQAASGKLASSAATATPGGTVTLTATGFRPNASLAFTFDIAPLTTVPLDGSAEATDANGEYVGTATIPDDAKVGDHFISVFQDGEDPDGSLVDITIVAQPTSAAAPETQSLSTYLKNGVTATFTGFAPGATVSFGIASASTGSEAGPDAVADADGTATLHFVPKLGTIYANVGQYSLSAFTAAGAVRAAPLTFSVTADAADTNPALVTTSVTPVAGPATPVKRAATFTG